jgi:hypothetical protein
MILVSSGLPSFVIKACVIKAFMILERLRA